MNDKMEKWNKFKETGKIEDYLKYKTNTGKDVITSENH